MKLLITAALASLALPAAAFEFKPEFYLGANFGTYQMSQSEEPVYASFTSWNIDALAGVKLFPYLAIEGRVGAGLNEDEETHRTVDNPAGVPVKLQNTLYSAVYLRPMISNDLATLYGLLGYAYAEFDGEPANPAGDANHDGLSYGIGASWVLNPKVDVRVEWKSLINAEALGVRGGSIGFTYTF